MSPIAPAGAPATTRALREEDLLAFTWVADPQISPDGSRIAFTRVSVDAEADEYVTSIWLWEAGGAAPRSLTSGRRDSQPRWSPDGRTLAFVRATEPKKPGQLWLLPMEGGEPAALTSLGGGVSSPDWSPDGKRLVFTSTHNPALDQPEQDKPKNAPARVVTRPVFRENNEGFTDFDHLLHVWAVAREGGAPRQLTAGRFAETSPCWSRDGRSVLFLSDRSPQPWFEPEDADIWAVAPDLDRATDGEQMRRLADLRGPITAYAQDPRGRLALVGSRASDPPRTYDQPGLFVTDVPGSAPREITAGYDVPVGEGLSSDQHPPRGGGVVPLAFAEEGAAVLALVAREGGARLARIELASSRVEELTPADRDLVYGTASADGRWWALTLGSARTPGDLYRFDAESRRLEKLWGPNDAALEGVALGEIEEFWYPSFDERRIQAWLVKPPGFDPAKRYPLVLEIHGGPHTAYGHGFFHEFHQLAGAGYLVLYTNPRGSTSYGNEFANVIQYRFPGDDARDLLAGVDAVVARGCVDEKRIGVTGGSGGGLLTNWLVAHDPRFAAAITQRCVSDWGGMYYSCDFAMYRPFWFRKPPFEDPQEYAARSPITFAERIETPLMIIHSEEDWRTPIAQGESLFRALKHRRKATVMIRFPGENHELSRSGAPSRRVQNQRHIRAWFDRWLQGVAHPEYDE